MSLHVPEGRLGYGVAYNWDAIKSKTETEHSSMAKLLTFLNDNDVQSWHVKNPWIYINGQIDSFKNSMYPGLNELYYGENKMTWLLGGCDNGFHERSNNIPAIGDRVAILYNIGFIGGARPNVSSKAFILKVKKIEGNKITFYDELESKRYLFDLNSDCYRWHIDTPKCKKVESKFKELLKKVKCVGKNF